MNDQTAATSIDPQKTHQASEFKYAHPLLSCRIDPSGQFVFATAQDNAIVRWHLASGKATVLAGHDSWVRALAFLPNGTLVSGGYDGQLMWWNVAEESPQPHRRVEAHQGWVRSVAVSPDGNLLVTGGNDNTVRLWSAEGVAAGQCDGHTNHVYSVAFHPQSGRVLSGDLKGLVREWDLASREQLRHFDSSTLWKYDAGFGADVGGVRAMTISADGKWLGCSGITEVSNAFAGIGNPLVVVFDLETGEKKQSFVTSKKLKGPGTGVRFHRDGFVIGSCGGLDGGHLLFWKLEAANEFFDLKLPDVCRDFDLHPDNMRLATTHEDKTLRLWQMTAKAG